MKQSNRAILLFAITGACAFSALAGEVKPGAVPGTINYQGRLERDNTPVTGPVRLNFRIYNAVSGGALRWPTVSCPGPELTVPAAQGIFSASIAPCWEVFSRAEPLYLEVQVESDILSPREPLNSVAYALVARKIEDGSSISVSTLIAAYQVLLATSSGNVGIGDMSFYDPLNPSAVYPDKKLTVNGGIRLLADKLYFPDGTQMNSANVGAAANLANPSDAVILSDSDNSGAGDIILQVYNTERARLLAANGNFGIGTSVPSERLEVNGNITNTAGSLAVYTRDYLVSRPRTAAGAVFRLMPRDNNSTAPGATSALELYTLTDTSTGTPVNFTRGVMVMTANGLEVYPEKGGAGADLPILFKTGGVERLRVAVGGNVGVGGLASPSDSLQSAGDISANAGVRGGRVSIGDYSGWNNIPNEVRSEAGYHLLLQQTNSYNVGVGTDSPREKLHVRGSVLADYGLIAATAAISGAMTVSGNFTANSGLGSIVKLSSTVIYGTLTVTGGVGSNQGLPAYMTADQTFTGLNTFSNRVTVSSNIAVNGRLGVGAANFGFSPAEYLQIGDGLAASEDAAAYLVSGSGTGNSRLYFYRGASEAARLETQNGGNLALVAGNTKSLVDGTYYRIYNSVFWVSTGTNNTTPALFVSSSMGNVGVGTAVTDPNWKLTVLGNIRITGGASNGIIFADGTKLTSANLGGMTAGSITHNDDAVVQSDADLNNAGKVILRAGALDGLVVNTGGNVGIGTQYPVAKLNVRGGDLVLGTPYNPYAADSKEDLIVGGNIVVDGNIEQRSASSVIFNALIVANDVYLSTATAGLTGIGTKTPQYKLDVAGDINLSGALRIGGTQRLSATGVLSNTTWNGDTVIVQYGGTGATTLTGIVHGNGTAAFTTGNVALASEVSGILPAANGGTGANLSAAVIGAVPYFSSTGVQSALAAGTANYLLQANGAAAPAWIQSTSTAAPDSIVRRDANGDFSAGNITATFSGTVSSATNIRGGGAGYVPYQSAADTTAMLAAGTANYLLQANGAAAPAWIQSTRANTGDTIVRRDANGDFAARNITASTFGGTVSSATHLIGGGAGYVPYQSAANTTAMLAPAPAANYVLLSTSAPSAPLGWVQSTDASVGNTIVRRDASGNFSASTITANQFNGTTTGGSAYIQSTVGSNDYIRVQGGDTGNNAGYLEIATADDGSEPIYVRQYQDLSGNPWGTLVRSATLLDGSGNTSFPGYIFAQYFNMNADVRTTQPEYLAGEWSNDKYLRYVSPANVTVGNSDMTDGLHAALPDAAPGANQLVRTGANTYTYLGWINTTSGDNGTNAISRVYASSDAFLRYYTLANFTSQIQGAASGSWGINITGTAVSATNLAANGTNCSTGWAPLGVDDSGNAESCFDVGTQTELTNHTGDTAAHSATDANTASTIVRRGLSGNFSAGTITATLTGNASGTAANVTGTVAVLNGGTGATTASGARTNLSVPSTTGGSASGTWAIDITGTAANVTGTVAVLNGGTGATTASGARTNLVVPSTDGTGASGTWGIDITGTAANVTGTVAVLSGGTGATTAAGARTNLGLGSIATQAAGSVAITGGSITGVTIALADGGTGATTAPLARTSLGVPATDGAGASGTWAISILGNAATVSGTQSTNNAVCWKAGGSLGYCSNAPDVNGACTCN